MQTVGLFGTIGATGSVSNLNITNASVAANIGFGCNCRMDGPPVSQWVGILAGQSGGTITNVTVQPARSAACRLSGVIAGGLVGQHGILTTMSGRSVSAGYDHQFACRQRERDVANGMDCCPGHCLFNAAGGLVGVNVGGSSIANSSSTGNVSGGASTWVGGLVGQNGFFSPADASGTITNSFSTGNVSVSRHQFGGGRPGRQQRTGIDHHRLPRDRHRRRLPAARRSAASSAKTTAPSAHAPTPPVP